MQVFLSLMERSVPKRKTITPVGFESLSARDRIEASRLFNFRQQPDGSTFWSLALERTHFWIR